MTTRRIFCATLLALFLCQIIGGAYLVRQTHVWCEETSARLANYTAAR